MRLGTTGAMTDSSIGEIGDRQWILLGASGQMLTQRTDPSMALLRPKIQNGKLFLEVHGKSFEMATDPAEKNVEVRKEIDVWGSKIQAKILRAQLLEQALSDFMGQRVSVAQFDQLSSREATSKGQGLGVQTRFTDTSPYLLTSLESLEDLNQRLRQKSPSNSFEELPMLRFRPNIVVSGGEAFGEDNWQTLTIGDLILESSKPCGRCSVTTVDFNTGKVSSSEPLKTLAQYRRKDRGVYFGQYFITKSFNQILKVGDQFTIG